MAFRPPQGSTFRHPAVQRAMQELAKAVEAQRAAGVGVTPYRHPDGSAFQSAKVQQGLRALGEAAGQAGQAPQPEYRRPSGSSLDSPAVRRAMQGIGDVQADVQFKRPTGSSLDSPAVQRASQGLAETQADVTFARPSGSSLDSPAVRRAMQGIGDVQADVQFKRPTGSSLDSPAVQRASQGLAETQADVSFARPSGSSLDSPAVRRAMQGIGEAGGVDVDFKRPNGSSLDSPAVVQGLRALGEAAGQASVVSFRRPSPTTLANSEVRQGVQALSKLQEQMERQGANPGVTAVRHPAMPDGLAERKAEAASKVQMPNNSLYFAHNALNGGEISPEMLARFDQPRYQTGCEYLLNMVPMPQGGITKRPGMVNVGIGGTDRAKLFPFVFSAGESRVLEVLSASSGSTLKVWFPDGTSYSTGLALPWQASAIKNVKMAQSADVLYCVHRLYKPLKIMRYGDQDWRWEYVKWTPSISRPTIFRVDVEGDSSGEKTTYKYVATAVDGETGEESVQSVAKSVMAYSLTQTYYVKVCILPMEGASEYRVYKYRGGVYGFVGRVDASNTSTVTSTTGSGQDAVTTTTTVVAFEDRNIEPDTEDTPPRAKDPFVGAGNYPSVVFFHQQRLGFASSDSHPLTVWLSQAGNFESMAASLPPADDDAIEATLAATQANRILWCQSDRTSLAIGTEGGEWILSGTEGAAVTPSDLSFQPQTYNGSEAGIPVLRAGSGLVYLQRGGRVVREFGYSFSSDRYESGDLGLLARHILKSAKVVSWAWQGEPYGIIWCVLSSGTMAGLTYMREHDVIGWHRHETAGTVEDVVAIPGEDGNTQIWMHVVRDGTRYVERLAPFFTGGSASGAVHRDGISQALFNARCIPSLPETQVQNGTSFLKVRKLNAVKARVIHSRGFKARVGTSAQVDVPARGTEYVNGHADWAVPLASGWRENDRLELIFDGADPATVLGIVTTVEIAEQGGGQK